MSKPLRFFNLLQASIQFFFYISPLDSPTTLDTVLVRGDQRLISTPSKKRTKLKAEYKPNLAACSIRLANPSMKLVHGGLESYQ
jgi:hypothetical protein